MDLLEQMTTFVDIVDAGTLSAAARRRRLSLAAVSRQLGALEDDLGTSLILRTTRAMQVTAAGRQFYEHAVRTLRDIETARASVKGAGGTLRVSAGVSIGLEQLVHVLPELAEAHPSLSIELRLEDHASDLVRDGVDVAIRAGLAPPDSTAFIARELARFPRWVVASPKYLRAEGVPKTPQALAKHRALIQLSDAGELTTWTLLEESDAHAGGETDSVRARGTDVVATGARVSSRAEAIIDRRTPPPSRAATVSDRRTPPHDLVSVRVRGTLRCTTPSALRSLAIAGSGIALLPDWLVRDDIAGGRLKRVLPDHVTPLVSLWALHRIELRDAPRVRVFLDHVTRAFAYHRPRA